MKKIIKMVEPVDEVCIKFSKNEIKSFGWKDNQKLSLKVLDNGNIEIKPFEEIEIDLKDFDRDILEKLIKTSCEEDISVNEVISNILKSYIDKRKV